MNRKQFLKHLERCGCVLLREGAKHSIWQNPANSFNTAVPRHIELKKFTCVHICKQLDIPSPASLS
jgi:mRNA interferase HicA